jgi:hypothetical protein
MIIIAESNLLSFYASRQITSLPVRFKAESKVHHKSCA